MKSYRNAVAVMVLTFVLASPVFAGVMHTGAPDPEPTPTTSSTAETATTEGEMHTGEPASTSEVADTITAAALNLLQSVFALL